MIKSVTVLVTMSLCCQRSHDPGFAQDQLTALTSPVATIQKEKTCVR